MHMRFLSGIKEMKFKESEVIKLKDQSRVKEKSTIYVAVTTNTVLIEYFHSNLNILTLA